MEVFKILCLIAAVIMTVISWVKWNAWAVQMNNLTTHDREFCHLVWRKRDFWKASTWTYVTLLIINLIAVLT